MTYSFKVYTLLTVALLRPEQVTGATTTFGKYFMTTVPILDHGPHFPTHEIVFELCTHYKSFFTVYIDENKTREEAEIARDNPVSHRKILRTNSLTPQEANTKHFRLHAEQNFGLTVFLISRNSSASFVVMPVDGWGKRYHAFTLRQNPFIQIVTDEAVKVVISFVFVDKSAKFFMQGIAYSNGMSLEVNLEKLTVFSIQNCTHREIPYYNSFSGTLVVGDNTFGVVSGSCDSDTEDLQCKDAPTNQSVATKDAAVEMLMPQETYGTEFILPVFSGQYTNGFYFMTSGEDLTLVHVYDGKNDDGVSFRLSRHTLMKELTGPTYLKSNKGIQVTFAWHSESGCRSSTMELGDATISTIVPMELFFYAYIWSLPADSTFTRDVSHYFTLVYRAKDIPEVHGQKLDPPKLLATMAVPYLPGWQISGFSFKKSGSVHGLNIVASKMKKTFGCYIYGVGYSEGYMHPAGYISSSINGVCTRTMASMLPGDLIDNDCDKKIDEEFSDSQDDDDDTIIDEDLLDMSEDEWMQTLINYSKEDSLRGVVHGSWGEWTEWQCSAMCPNRTMVRSRQCNKPTPANGGRPCDGMDKEGKDGTCYMGQTCPDACPDYTWDLNCVGDCLKCKDPCNKLTGICDSCASGYKSPNTGCNIPCGFNEYGFNCMGNCTEKCGKDCYERENGTCSALAHGQWGEWSRWLCTQDCRDSRQARKRECDNPKPSEHGNPCPDSNIEYRDFICYKGLICPQDCPPFRFDFNCAQGCEQCEDDCNKFNGSCTICKEHFKDPLHWCREVCGLNETGINCEINCYKKCGEECNDPIKGICAIHGGWAEWEEWHCTPRCKNSREIRLRGCTKPKPEFGGHRCFGDFFESRKARCYQGVTCSEDCKPFTWDLNCVQSCENCVDDCNKINGSCTSCRKGFKYPEAGCNKECEELEYGENCMGNCQMKCGEDCYERVNGECPVHGNWGVWSEWACGECPEENLLRSRKCDNPEPQKGGRQCEGNPMDSKSAACFADLMYCYDDCPPKTWALNCTKRCPNCQGDCNKRTGVCESCKPGFKNSNLSCTTPCEDGEYGADCVGSCFAKCNDDCVDRVHGICPAVGTWGAWGEWKCTHFCNDTRVIRYRWCRKSTDGTEVECPDNNFEMAPSDCYVNTTCPEDCPDYYFGIECVSCLHCKDQCNKFNGTCQQCLPGYRDPDTGCQSVCMKNFYGKDCNGSCLSKCGSDCADRVTGECPSSSGNAFYWSPLLLLLIVIPVILYCLKPYIKKSKHDQSSEQQTSVSGVKIFHIPPLVEISDIPPPEESYAIPPPVESSAIPPPVESSAIPTPSKTSTSTPSKTSI